MYENKSRVWRISRRFNKTDAHGSFCRAYKRAIDKRRQNPGDRVMNESSGRRSTLRPGYFTIDSLREHPGMRNIP